MNYRYVVVCSTFVKPGDIRTTYGIAYVDENMVSIKCYSDISDDYEGISDLVDICNKYKLDLVHLPDVIEDFLG